MEKTQDDYYNEYLNQESNPMEYTRDDYEGDSDREEQKRDLMTLIDAQLKDFQTGDLIKSSQISGVVEGIILVALTVGLFSAEECDVIVDRMQAITELKNSDIIHYEPLLFIPDGPRGDKFKKEIIAASLQEAFANLEEMEKKDENKKK